MNEKERQTTMPGQRRLQKALEAALIPLEPPQSLLVQLQSHVRTLGETPAPRPSLAAWFGSRETPYVGIAGVFMVLMTIALGFRTAGSIIGAIALAGEINKQLREKRTTQLTPTG